MAQIVSKVSSWASRDDRKLYLLWPPFPGYEGAFASQWPTAGWRYEIDRDHLVKLANQKDPNTRAYDVVSAYCEALERAQQRDETFHVMICIIPDVAAAREVTRSVVACLPNDLSALFVHAAVLVLADDVKEYQQLCSGLLDRFGRTRNGNSVYSVARIGTYNCCPGTRF